MPGERFLVACYNPVSCNAYVLVSPPPRHLSFHNTDPATSNSEGSHWLISFLLFPGFSCKRQQMTRPLIVDLSNASTAVDRDSDDAHLEVSEPSQVTHTYHWTRTNCVSLLGRIRQMILFLFLRHLQQFLPSKAQAQAPATP
jgi:hypothetical protein